jgi:thiol-disulfide isomerase/thioredoxin
MIMRRLAICLVVFGLSVSVGRADDPLAPQKSSALDDAPTQAGSPGFDALKKELAEAQKNHAKEIKELKDAQKALAEAKSDADKDAARQKIDALMKEVPGPKFAPRFLQFAENHPQDPMAFNAAMLAFKHSARPATKDNTLGKTLAFLRENYADKPQIMQLVRTLESNKGHVGEGLLREVIAKNPNHRIQGHACNALYEITTKAGEKESLNKMLKGKYADLFPDLSVGKHAPEVAVKDIHGNDAKLSELKGKVVVLDIWATWCPHCRSMIPQERRMVERLKGKPFELVSISMDAKKQTLTDFLAKQEMPWTHWWVGSGSNFEEDWKIEYFPTIYVLDARGVIRYTGVSGDDLDNAVNELLKKKK